MSSSIGKALNSLLILKLSTLQVSSLEEDLFSIDRNLASKSLEQGFGRIGVINQLGRVLMKEGRQIFQLYSNLSADEIPTAREELASSPSSSEISMAKENKLSGESCS